MNAPIMLQPCPFCGGPPAPYHRSKVPDEHGDVYVEAHVFCHECGAQGQVAGDWYEPGDPCAATVRNACELWNRRDSRHGHGYILNERLGNNIYPRHGHSEDRA